MQSLSYITGIYNQAGNLLFDDKYESPWAVREITRQNWIPKKTISSCMNPSCHTAFSTVYRRHNCRRCGQVFCRACVQFYLRLNKMAQPDPDGERCKVCKKCHDENKLDLDEVDGQKNHRTKSHTEYFLSQRNRCKEQAMLKNVPGSEMKDVLLWLLGKLDLDKECQRLLNGFNTDVGKSTIEKALNGLKSTMSTPKWMKSDLYDMAKVADCCHLCKKKFDSHLSKRYCRVCGIHVCKSSECSSKDLLLYIPDNDKENSVPRKPRLAIIRIVGCPTVQPILSLHLRVCPSCKEQLIQKQLNAHEEETNVFTSRKFVDVLIALNDKIKEGEDLVKEKLPQLRETVDSLEDGDLAVTPENIKHLEDMQADLTAALAQHVTIIDQLKKLKPQTDCQATMLELYVKAKYDFYFNNISVFRAMKHRLEECLPTESIEAIQRMMEGDPLRGAHVYMHQLVIESTSICEKFDIDPDIPICLSKLGTAILCDVQEYFQDKIGDTNAHIDSVLEMAEARAKDHSLICPSQSLLKKKGSKHVHELMHARVEYILTEVSNQINLVSGEDTFPDTKKALATALETLKDQMKQERSFYQEFVFVDNDLEEKEYKRRSSLTDQTSTESDVTDNASSAGVDESKEDFSAPS